jgi:hypothetical protein
VIFNCNIYNDNKSEYSRYVFNVDHKLDVKRETIYYNYEKENFDVINDSFVLNTHA